MRNRKKQNWSLMKFRSLILTFFLLVLNCKRATTFHNNTNDKSDLFSEKPKNQGTNSSQIEISKGDLENIGAGDGLTVGNGQNESETIEENSPIEIFGTFLTTCKYYESRILCLIPSIPKNHQEFIDGLVFYDQSGMLIPGSELELETLYAEAVNKTYLQVKYSQKISGIIEKKSIELITNLENFINSWIATASYIENKQMAKISYSQASNKNNSIYLACSANCPDYDLFLEDQVKFVGLCNALEATTVISGMVFNEYFSGLDKFCEQSAQQLENQKIIEEKDQSIEEQQNTQNPDTWSNTLKMGEILEVGSKLVNGGWSMVLGENSIRIESDDYLHTLNIGTYRNIEIIQNLQGDGYELVANSENNEQMILYKYSFTTKTPELYEISLFLSEAGGVTLKIESEKNQFTGFVHNKIVPWELPE